MRLAGLLLLASGWTICLAAVILLPGTPARGVFIAAGFAVEALGLGLALRRQAAIGGGQR